ncbi:S-adenosyl-L-methionine-dependent methyltransferase [Mycena belliarum]|uniref:S-adenosyl-L-methionine-dependent methyltransferase n=1 Tax=Mycena belliarum TaxID=1033014 RepID=A0AAD6UF63_9AGAR|nr:S-adenosyl-L-methionine-dependent methyltransferase [Mycena belliae]
MAAPIHPTSQGGFAKGTNELYNKARPQYQPKALSHLRGAIKSTGPLNVVEVGAGTGLFTRALLAHPGWAAIRAVRAVEPSEGMREAFAKYTADERVVLSGGTFDATGVESGWADLVVVATAFHWCADYETAAAEFARILKPGGVLSLLWNAEDREAAQWLSQCRERAERDDKGAPNWRSGHWRELYSAPSYVKSFNPPEEKIFRYDAVGTVGDIVRRGLTSSRVAILTDAQKEAFARDVEDIVQRGDGKVWVDEEKGTFVYPHMIPVVISERM